MSYTKIDSKEQDRVNREQDYVKEKGREVVDTAKETVRDIKDGNVKAELPSNDKVTNTLQKGEDSLDRFQSSERGQQMGAPAHKVVDDLKVVLSDQQAVLNQKNDGDLLQNIVRHFWALLQELRHDPTLKESFEEWQGHFTSLMSSGDVSQFFYQAYDIFTSLKDTDEFLELLSRLIDVLKSTIAEKAEQVTDGQTTTAVASTTDKKQQRDQVVEQIKATLMSLGNNETWRVFVMRSKEAGQQVKAAGHNTTDSAREVAYRVQDSHNFQELLNDFKTLLQRLVGQKRSVEPLFDYSKAAVNDILADDELSYLIAELQILLNLIVENPALLDDEITQQRVTNLAERADRDVEKLRTNKNIIGTKEEGRQVAQAIKDDPTSAKFINDLRTLWHDLASDRPGELVDGDVMKSIRQMIIPLFLEHLNNVPLPTVEGTGSFLGKYKYSIENMKISLPELIPDNIHIRFAMDMDAKPLELEAKTDHTYVYIQASNIHVHLRDANFSYNRLTVPKLHDDGVFDVDTTGSGMAVWMKMELKAHASQNGGQALVVQKSDVKINQKFHITFHDSNHNKLYEMLTHVFANKIKNAVIDNMNQKLKEFGSYFSDQLMMLIDQARSRSNELAVLAREKGGQANEKMGQVKEQVKEQVRSGMENLKVQAQDKINEADRDGEVRATVQETKEGAKSAAKGVVAKGNEIVQEKLDEQKDKLEQQKRENQFDRVVNQPNPYGAAPLPASQTPIDHTTVISKPPSSSSSYPSTQSM